MHPTAQISMAFRGGEIEQYKVKKESSVDLGVHLEGKHNFGGAVPTCCNIFGH